MSTEFERFALHAPDDLAGFKAALIKFGPQRVQKLALFFRVPGEYEDGSRERARAAVDRVLAEHGLADRAEMITVVGCEGATTPCAFVFADVKDDKDAAGEVAPRLAIGLARGRPPADDELDAAAFAMKVAEIVRVAVADGGMAAGDVATVFVNTPPPRQAIKPLVAAVLARSRRLVRA